MEFAKTWIGVIGELPPDDRISVDIAALVRKLLLFDRLIIQSIRLREFGPLASAFGYHGVAALLRTGVVKVSCHALTTGQVGQSDLKLRAAKGLLPLYSYSFVGVKEAYREQYISECMQNVEAIDSLSHREKRSLKQLIARQIVSPADSVEPDALAQLRTDLAINAPLVRLAIAIETRRRKQVIVPADLPIRVIRLDEEDFRVETAFHERLQLSLREGHDIIQTALLAVGGLNQRIAEMKAYQAVPNFTYRDLPVLDEKFAWLQSQISPETNDQQLAKLLSLPGLPEQAGYAGRIDVEELLVIRDSTEGREFRAWFHSAGSDDVRELEERWNSLATKVAANVRRTFGRLTRFAVSNGVGLIPGYGVPLGLAVGALDTFLLDRVLPLKGPIAFLKYRYPSVFKKP